MLGADNRTPAERRQVIPALEDPAGDGHAAAVGPLRAFSVLEAIEAAERTICGGGAVRDVSVAAGLAAAGRAACALPRDDPGNAVPGLPMVVHRIARADRRPPDGYAFELVAGTAQEAVDHCLVAHRLARAIGRPGLCTIDAALADRLALVRMPESGPQREEHPASDDRSTRRVTAALHDALRQVARETHRALGALDVHRMDGARHALLAFGSARAVAGGLADRLHSAGVDCGAVGIVQIDPFPSDELTALLQGIESVVLLAPHGAGRDAGELAEHLRHLVKEDCTLGVSVCDPRRGADVWDEVVGFLGLADLEAVVAPEPQAPTLTLGLTPGGAWTDRALLDAAELAAAGRELGLARPATELSGTGLLVLGAADGRARGNPDVLCVAHPGALHATRELSRIAEQGVLLCAGIRGPAEQAWSWLDDAQRGCIAERKLRVRVLDHAALLDHADGDPERLRRGVAAAMLAAIEDGPTRPPWTREETASWREAARWLRGTSPESAAATAPRVAGPPSVEPVDGETDAIRQTWEQRLHDFHLRGVAPFGDSEPLEPLPLRPAVSTPLMETAGPLNAYPLVRIFSDDGRSTNVMSMALLLRETLLHLQEQGESLSMLGPHVMRVVGLAARLLETRGGWVPFAEILQVTLDNLASEFDLTEAGAEQLSREAESLRAHLPRNAMCLGLDRRTLLTLHGDALHERSASLRKKFSDELTRLVQSLRELLQLDDSHSEAAGAPAALSSSLGVAQDFVNTDELSHNLPKRQGVRRMGEVRRRRIENALRELSAYRERQANKPEASYLAPEELDAEVLPEGARITRLADPLAAATGVFDGLAAEFARTLRAVRVARLEARGGYDAERHDPIIAAIDWQSFTDEELLLLPQVVVLETGRRLRGRSLASLSLLLRSGRPIHVVAIDRNSELQREETWETLSGYHPGLGYLAVAHRGAFVLQSTLGAPQHLVPGLMTMARSLRPAMALVELPDWKLPGSAWARLVTDWHARAAPCLLYDPERGEHWLDRLTLEHNPQPDAPWPVYELGYVDASGEPATRNERVTFAHAAALDPAYRPHFRIVPRAAWSDGQLEIVEYLTAEPEVRRRSIPFIWVVDQDGQLARAAMTRELAFACRDRARAWHVLQELAGIDNAYARRAEQDALRRAEREKEAAIKSLQATHAEELARSREQAVEEAMGRLANALMNLDASAVALPTAQPPTPAPAIPARPAAEPAAAEAPAAIEEEEEEEVSFDEPYIDTILCTSCNECTNLNGRMFKYDQNKQAVLADVEAGTFEELVKAAEKCPARCIHPGAPREGDPTATDELIARARVFN